MLYPVYPLYNTQVGDMVEVKGPFPKIAYKANMKKKLGMLCGGTGITPMLQVIKEILKNPEDKTEIHLVFANDTVEDILLKSTLDDLAKKHKNFKVTYVVAKPPANGWAGEKGWVNAEIIKKTMPGPHGDHMVFVCGPPGFMAAVSGDKTKDYKQGLVSGLLKDAGYNGQ
jgi:cytochrome-b5 reductase